MDYIVIFFNSIKIIIDITIRILDELLLIIQ